MIKLHSKITFDPDNQLYKNVVQFNIIAVMSSYQQQVLQKKSLDIRVLFMKLTHIWRQPDVIKGGIIGTFSN